MTRTKILWLLPLALAACATPREACISDAERPLREVTREIGERELNLARGYRLVHVSDTELALTSCNRTTPDGQILSYPCQRPVVTTRTEPVAIDASEERARLARLRAERDRLQPVTRTRIRQCRARFPAEV